ncbi:hypothetical protein PRZ48_011678 [Zasmidium cellare]|uniref:Major facilitator superfamily (MFS) profile domain-containing protein n=1 Tax=Zasmidium cellare TaxID=395010 RepID=A0ABR0E7J1_ZASCE|nr:hypothetical protein PRZ48_011678 [Zasmidium cellare]
MASSTIELRELQQGSSSRRAVSQVRQDVANESSLHYDSSGPGAVVSHTLPPVDGGRGAWLFLLGCFMLDGIVWGFPLSFGVFQVYYSTHEPFSHGASQNSGIAAIGTTATGVAYFASPFFGIAMQRYPHTRRPAMHVGLVAMVLGLIGASFCNTVAGLLATQGVLYGIGCILLYFPATLFLDEWFVKRKALAYGISWSGTGTAGVVVPFIMQWLLDSYGFRSALRILGCRFVAISICAVRSMVAAFVFWGLASSAPMLYLFAIIWGFFTGGFNTTWPGCAAAMRRLERNGNVDTGTLIGLMAAGKGVGGVVGGPLSEKLLEVGWHAHSKFAYGSSYGVLVVFCGVSAAFGGAACVGRLFKVI